MINVVNDDVIDDMIHAVGLTPLDTIEPDGELHLFASNGKRDDSRRSPRRRLPAYGRAVRHNLNSGLRPVLGGGCVAVCIGWERCPLTSVVCSPADGDPETWNFAFLAGVDTIAWHRAIDRGYALAVRARLIAAGSPIVAMLCIPEPDEAAG